MRLKQTKYLIILLSVLLLSCEKIWKNSNNYPISYFHSWPMYQHDPQHTGRSPYKGIQYGRIKWKINVEETNYSSVSTPIVDREGIIYIGTMHEGLVAITPEGNIRWKFTVSAPIESTPAINKDGIIYFACRDQYFYAITRDGTLEWKYLTPLEMGRINPIIGDDGTVYFVADSAYAFTPEGKIKWNLPNMRPINWPNYSTPALDHRGYIYMGLDDEHLFIVKPDGTIWKKIKKGYLSISSPVIDEQNNVYYYTGTGIKLVALDDEANFRWEQEFNYGGSTSPVVSKNGSTLYLPLWWNFAAFNTTDGSVKWSWCSYDMYVKINNSPILDSDDNVYIGVGQNLIVFNPEGEILHKILLTEEDISKPGTEKAYSSPVLCNNRVVYIKTSHGNLCAIE